MRTEIKYLITNINVYLFIRFEINVFSLQKIMIIQKQRNGKAIGNNKISFVHENK